MPQIGNSDLVRRARRNLLSEEDVVLDEPNLSCKCEEVRKRAMPGEPGVSGFFMDDSMAG